MRYLSLPMLAGPVMAQDAEGTGGGGEVEDCIDEETGQPCQAEDWEAQETDTDWDIDPDDGVVSATEAALALLAQAAMTVVMLVVMALSG